MAKEQAYYANGAPAQDVALARREFDEHLEYVMQSVQVWVWRRTSEGLEVLIQKRSMEKSSYPGMLDISCAGHIDAGETPLQAAPREFQEELGNVLDIEQLTFMFSIRKTNVPNLIANVYSYEVNYEFSPVFQDGEVDAVYWKSLGELEAMSMNPQKYNLVPHGKGYYTVLIERLRLYENH